MEDLKTELERILRAMIIGDSVSPKTAADAIVEFYQSVKSDQQDSGDDGDMILFQYGSYNWDGQGDKFELDFTRQIADPESDEFYQIQLILYYHPKDIGAIESFNLWSMDEPTLNDWINKVESTDGFNKASIATPFDYKIELTKT